MSKGRASLSDHHSKSLEAPGKERAFPEHWAFNKSFAHFRKAKGRDLFSRGEGFSRYLAAREDLRIWPYARTLTGAPSPASRIHWSTLDQQEGINLASQDYLSLSSHPSIRSAILEAFDSYGVHSAGSAALLGNTLLSRRLEEELAFKLGYRRALLYPTGWAAGFGMAKDFVGKHDVIVLDELAHACLREGAFASGARIIMARHLDVEHMVACIRKARTEQAEAGILAITEGVFSMDSDTPDIAVLHETCRQNGAILAVDVAHDFGALGPGGTGTLGSQNLLGQVDLVMGSFSKTFASNGGFVLTNDDRAYSYLKYFSGSHTFSNALSPIQCAVVRATLRIVNGPEGEALRLKLLANVKTIREQLTDAGARCLGTPSAIVPVLLGKESSARLTMRALKDKPVLANLVEYPAVPINQARLRLQVQAAHTKEQMELAARHISEAISEVSRTEAGLPG